MTRRLLSALGAAIGWLLWTLRVRRRVVMENLRLAFPERSEAERRAIGRATFTNVGRMAPAFFLATRLTPDELDRIFVYDPGALERIVAARDLGKGVIVCTAHFGNFENLAAVHNLKGFPITMITRPLGAGWLGRLWRGGRARAGVEELVVTRGQTLPAAIRAIRHGKVLGYVIDQNVAAHRAIFPTFFGAPAATSPTPAYLALRTGATVLFALDVPQPDGRHRIVVEGPLAMPDTGDRDRDVLAFMQDLNDRLERWVRLHPEHWYWLHRRWKTRPEHGDRRRRGRRPVPPAAPPPGAGSPPAPGAAAGVAPPPGRPIDRSSDAG
jgi:KDO2-lipid IV(A) lauroyltransferase